MKCFFMPNKSFALILLLYDLVCRYYLEKSTFLLEHFMAFMQTAFSMRRHATRAKHHAVMWKRKINTLMAWKDWNLTINPAFCPAGTCLGCLMQLEWRNGSAANFGHYDSWAKVLLNGDRSCRHSFKMRKKEIVWRIHSGLVTL